MADFSLGIVADDLTGGAESAVSFGQGQNGALLFFHDAAARVSLANERAWAVSTTSRPLTPDEAFERSRTTGQALLDNASLKRPVRFFKKVDSLLRGNIGAEVEGFMEGACLSLSLIAPAHPLNGRTTEDDIHRVGGVPVAETEAGRDPVTPVRSSSLSRVVAAQCTRLVSHIARSRLEVSPDALATEIRSLAAQGIAHFTFDATTPEHLERIALLALEYFPDSLPVGSGGLAQAIAKLGGFAMSPASPFPLSIAAPPLVILGTASETARRQVETLCAAHACRITDISPQSLLDGSAQSLPESLAAPIAPRPIDIIRLTPPEGAPSIDLTILVAEQFGHLVADIVKRRCHGALYASGGDTAIAAFTALNGEAIRVLDEIVTGLVRGRIIGGAADGLPIATKPGAFGADDALLRWVNSL